MAILIDRVVVDKAARSLTAASISVRLHEAKYIAGHTG